MIFFAPCNKVVPLYDAACVSNQKLLHNQEGKEKTLDISAKQTIFFSKIWDTFLEKMLAWQIKTLVSFRPSIS